jgi:ABC-type multidrug transport system ATPase subunit
VLHLEDVTYTIPVDGEEVDLLRDVGFTVSPGSFVAIVGPSGCGKTTLLKTIAGFQEQSSGDIVWKGRSLVNEEDFAPTEIGYVPQFSIAYDLLTVEESVLSAVQLRVKISRSETTERTESILKKTGLELLRDQRVGVLSGGQKRRLGLAMELASNPELLLCDEVTSGLDANAERDIVQLMHAISRDDNRIVLNVTHSFGGLEFYDSVLVIYEGLIVFHGPPEMLSHYFSVKSEGDVYERLEKRKALDWRQSWIKHRDHYEDNNTENLNTTDAVRLESEAGAPRLPGFVSQMLLVFFRRLKLFTRDRGQVLLHLAILLGFPCLVVVFATSGVGQMPKSPLHPSDGSLFEAIDAERHVIAEQFKIGGLISGIVMIQILLLTLMGSNNSSREIAAERLLFEKEKFAGLRPASYLFGKVLFLGLLVVSQSVWMSVFVDRFCDLPGPFFPKTTLLILANGAMTGICLGISSIMRTSEQASLMGIYFVGFQLPLSGAVLPLSGNLEKFSQPFVSAYWSWAGQLELMKDTDFWVGIQRATSTEIVSQSSLSVLALSTHLVAGLIMAWFGLRRTQWDE